MLAPSHIDVEYVALPDTTTHHTEPQNLENSELCQKLYLRVSAFVRRTVYAMHIPQWSGQEQDMVDDITQETLTRVVQWSRQVQSGERLPILSLEALAKVIARNYCLDIRRRDKHLIPLKSLTDDLYEPSMEDIALEQVYLQQLLVQIVRIVAGFPKKQRDALFFRLVSQLNCHEHLAALPGALQAAGLSLQDYQRELPATELANHRANVALSRKRLRQSPEFLKYFACS